MIISDQPEVNLPYMILEDVVKLKIWFEIDKLLVSILLNIYDLLYDLFSCYVFSILVQICKQSSLLIDLELFA